MSPDGGSAACRIRRRSPSADIFALVRCFCNLSRNLQSGSVCPPYIISPLYSLSIFQNGTSAVSSINFSSPKTSAGPLPPSPLLHLHLGFTRLPKCFLGVRWLIGSHLLGESGLYGILGNLCQEFYHINSVFCLRPEPTDSFCLLHIVAAGELENFEALASSGLFFSARQSV